MDLQARKKDIDDAIEQSKNNHMMLLGRLEEIKYMMEQAKPVEEVKEGEVV